jgi:hypothetical protein
VKKKMVKEGTKFWTANAQLRIKNLAWDCFYDEDKFKGLRVLIPKTRGGLWLLNGKLQFDIGANLKGWLRFEARNISSKLSPLIDKVDKGMYCISLQPSDDGKELIEVRGTIPVGTASMLIGDPSIEVREIDYKWKDTDKGLEKLKVHSTEGHDYLLPPELPIFPLHTFVEDTKGQSRAKFWYDTRDPIEAWVRISCRANNIESTDIEQMLNLLGKSHGLGARHKQGVNGIFELLKFDKIDEQTLKITS